MRRAAAAADRKAIRPRSASYLEQVSGEHHLALVCGEVRGASAVLVRVQSHCLLGTVFRSSRCNCAQRLDAALHLIATEGCGVLLYLSRESSPADLGGRLDCSVPPPPLYESGAGSQILADLGVGSTRLLASADAA